MPKIISDNPLGQIGRTPLVHLNRLTDRNTATVWGKMEGSNPGGSVKDRIALAMIEQAEKDGCISLRRHHRRTDQRQHRHRPLPGLCRQGLQADPDHAGHHDAWSAGGCWAPTARNWF